MKIKAPRHEYYEELTYRGFQVTLIYDPTGWRWCAESLTKFFIVGCAFNCRHQSKFDAWSECKKYINKDEKNAKITE